MSDVFKKLFLVVLLVVLGSLDGLFGGLGCGLLYSFAFTC